jgi:peptide/nickel transport system permease protein
MSVGAAPVRFRVRHRRLDGICRFLADPVNAASAALAAILIATAVLAPALAPYPRDQIALEGQWLAPGLHHWMGTDQYGRDILSRVIYGARVSLSVAFIAIAAAAAVGIALGAIAGFFRGWIDEAIMRLIDILMSIPDIVLALAIVGLLGPSLPDIILALAVYRTAQFARITRGSVLSVMALDYITACRGIGMSSARIILQHALPNSVGPIIVLATVLFGNVILTEATLSFLGMGIQPPEPSWGVMIADGNEYLMFAPWLSLFPGLFLLLTMLAFNLLGDGLRDYFDPRGHSVI